MNNKYYIGIDGGIHGGITVLDNEQNIIESIVMPVIKTSGNTVYDLDKLNKFFEKYNDEKLNVYIMFEEAHTLPKNGPKQNFRIGECFGIIKGILSMLCVSYEIVRAKVWQKEIFQGQKVMDTKQASILYCKQKYPNQDWRATERCKIDHDGKTDSCCIGVYCYRLNR